MLEYPKIETLYDRDAKTFRVQPDRLRLPEFAFVDRWLVTEKIDGTNVRVELTQRGFGLTTVTYGGRTDNAQMPMPLLAWLQSQLNSAVVAGAFDAETNAILFGEGYGAGIQKGGTYRSTAAFRLFDVLVFDGERRWWLNWPNVEDIAAKLGVPTVPVLARGVSLKEALTLVRQPSETAKADGGKGGPQEGIVCRTDPLLLLRDGQRRLVWKLKGRDF